MSLENVNKLKNLLLNWAPKTPVTSFWLLRVGVSAQLARRYVESGWLEPIGHGAFKRTNEKVGWEGALNAISTQLEIPVHLGALSAISFQGAAHYVRMGKETLFFFSPLKTRLPKWFKEYDWGQPVIHLKTAFLPPELGVSLGQSHEINIKVSSLERAILECLYLSPKHVDLLECYQITEGLQGLRPKLVQELLENCTSVRVKRLFLFMADKASLPVMKHLKLENIDLGKGDRSIVKHGKYDAKYRLTLPEELTNDKYKLQSPG